MLYTLSFLYFFIYSFGLKIIIYVNLNTINKIYYANEKMEAKLLNMIDGLVLSTIQIIAYFKLSLSFDTKKRKKTVTVIIRSTIKQ